MGDISKNFSRHEFACKCGACGHDAADIELVEVLEDLRAWAGDTITVTSGNRCDTHNTDIGGAPSSQHLLGKAADIRVAGKSPLEVYAYLDDKYPGKYGVGRYSAWVHIDVRQDTARWSY